MSSNTIVKPQIEDSWFKVLEEEFNAPYFAALKDFLKNEKAAGKTIFPPGPDIFTAFNTTTFENVKVVILGQDPYHGVGQAHGLSFSVKPGIKPPPSLKNMYKELVTDIDGFEAPNHGYLLDWAKQGVLMLNAILTVRASEPASHHKQGWEQFTDAAIRKISSESEHVVFLLWGKYAQNKESLIDASKHLILKAAHPSPFSAHNGFFGCQHFSKANDYLSANGRAVINWKLSPL